MQYAGNVKAVSAANGRIVLITDPGGNQLSGKGVAVSVGGRTFEPNDDGSMPDDLAEFITYFKWTLINKSDVFNS